RHTRSRAFPFHRWSKYSWNQPEGGQAIRCARRKCEAWRRDYNEDRTHNAIGNKAPIELIDRSVACGPRCPQLAGKKPAGRSKDGEQFINWNFPAKIGPKTGKQVTMISLLRVLTIIDTFSRFSPAI